MKYLKRYNEINESLSKRSYIYDINDILRDLDMVDIPEEFTNSLDYDGYYYYIYSI